MRKAVVFVVATGLVLVSAVAVGAFQFLKLAETGTANVNATLTLPMQAGLTGVLIEVANTGAVPDGAYYKVSLDSVDGAAYDAELHRADDEGLLSHLWVLDAPLGMKVGDKILVTYPNTGTLTGGTWSAQGFFATK